MKKSFGNETRVKVVKNKVAPPFKTAEFEILYGEGISREGEVIDLGVEANLIEKSGAWFSYNGQKIGQGKVAARQWLKEHPEEMQLLEEKLRVFLKEKPKAKKAKSGKKGEAPQEEEVVVEEETFEDL